MNTSIELLTNIEKVHTTEMGILRIKKNLSLDNDNVVEWCKSRLTMPEAIITRQGKNWYVNIGGAIITINAHSYTIITAHKDKNN